MITTGGIASTLFNISYQLGNMSLAAKLKNGAGWSDDGTPVCNWPGIACKNNELQSIDLANFALNGQPGLLLVCQAQTQKLMS